MAVRKTRLTAGGWEWVDLVPTEKENDMAIGPNTAQQNEVAADAVARQKLIEVNARLGILEVKLESVARMAANKQDQAESAQADGEIINYRTAYYALLRAYEKNMREKADALSRETDLVTDRGRLQGEVAALRASDVGWRKDCARQTETIKSLRETGARIALSVRKNRDHLNGLATTIDDRFGLDEDEEGDDDDG